MKRHAHVVARGSLLVAVITSAACVDSIGGPAGGPAEPLFDEFTPTWTTASWTGGAIGSPNSGFRGGRNYLCRRHSFGSGLRALLAPEPR